MHMLYIHTKCILSPNSPHNNSWTQIVYRLLKQYSFFPLLNLFLLQSFPSQVIVPPSIQLLKSKIWESAFLSLPRPVHLHSLHSTTNP